MELKDTQKTEFGIFPKQWSIRTIQSLIDDNFITGHLDGNHGELYPRTSEFKEDGVPYITANDLTGSKVDLSCCKFLSYERASLFKKGIAKDGDVLFAHNATVGPTGLLRTNYDYVILSTTATYYRCNPEKLNNKFFLQLLQSPMFIRQYRSVMAQSTRFQVPITTQRKLSVFLPCLKEQDAIANALSNADAYIESLEKLIAKKQLIKKGVMQELLTGKRRLKGYTKETIKIVLGDIANLYQPQTISAKDFSQFGYPVYGANGIIGYYDRTNHTSWQVTVTCRGSTCGTVNRTADLCWITGNAMVVNCDDNPQINKEFLYYKLCLQDLKSCVTGTGQPQIVRAPLAKVELEIPLESEEQEAIASTLKDMEVEIQTLEKSLQKAHQIKQGMMQQLLTGRIRLI